MPDLPSRTDAETASVNIVPQFDHDFTLRENQHKNLRQWLFQIHSGHEGSISYRRDCNFTQNKSTFL
jgi:hypothetical protein